MNQSQKAAIKTAHMALVAIEFSPSKLGCGPKLRKLISNAINELESAFDGYLILRQSIKPHDFTYADHGSIFLLTPCSKAAQVWIEEHLPDDAPWHGMSVAIERRYVLDILRGIAMDGLIFQQD